MGESGLLTTPHLRVMHHHLLSKPQKNLQKYMKYDCYNRPTSQILFSGTPSGSIFSADLNAPPMFFPGQDGMWTESKSSGVAIKVTNLSE